MTKYDVGVLSRGDQVLASGRLGKITSVHEPKWVDHKTKRHMHEFQGADVTFDDGVSTYFHAKDLKVFGTTTTNRPPSCDLPPEHYQPKLKPCPMCGFGDTEVIEGTIDYQGYCPVCQMQGPDRATEIYAIKRWNAIPSRSEVLELIRLVDGYFAGKTDPLDLRICATKLREEIRG